jgi:hypothetical protein
VWKVEGPLPNPGARRPLGVPALGPTAAGSADAPEVLGPVLEDRDEPQPGDDAPPAA